jgi:ornithine cyclodeaminase/alanine dehydrogenase-like protein (mu-crystallin family)
VIGLRKTMEKKMLFLDDNDFNNYGYQWKSLTNCIDSAIKTIRANNYHQPIKPYLRFPDPKNRIIAMPAYLGGDINVAGIKWIASFPSNIEKGKKRANSVTILNSAETGRVKCIINTPLVSVLRTVAVSSFILGHFFKNRINKVSIGVIGLGPIGLMHIEMLQELYADNIKSVHSFDLNTGLYKDDLNIEYEMSVENLLLKSDIVITATVSDSRYIASFQKKDGLILDVSLRDCSISLFERINGRIVVDSWDEVCRENTDIELFHKNCGLEKKDVVEIANIDDDYIFPIDTLSFFAPMGMAVFDIAIAEYFYKTYAPLKE